jgi:hypothetical protein
MGAIARQVLQVKRKNSTNCNPPDARLTVAGSVAWSSGPREVATGKAVAASEAVGVTDSGIEVGTAAVAGRVAAAGGSAGDSAGAHAARTTARRLTRSTIEGNRGSEKRIFLICL